ncbi:MAG: DUF2029 domain-containing protein [Deltaproteobacteria bacterium]|nr:DUF2029 domain-containing protein [Deltaproteobacteria bacterium]MBI3293442.1 DUF2029 domain-containing protein [Deltaproteobacteria bacterium]
MLFLVGLLLIPCWVIGVLYEVDILTAYDVISRIPTDLGGIYGSPIRGLLGRYFYPPFTLVFFSPLSGLSFPVFKYVWLALQTLSYGVVWWCLVKLFPQLFRNTARVFWVWIIAINPLHNNFQSNNIQIWLGALLLLAELLSRRPDFWGPFLAGLLVALTTHIKVYPLFLVVYYFISAGKVMRVGLLSGLVGFALLPLLFFGPNKGADLYRSFFLNLTTYSAENSPIQVSDILCLPSLIARLLDGSPLALFAGAFTKVITVVASATFFLWCFRTRLRRDQWVLAWLLMALLNPSTRVHYFVFLIPAFAYWAERVSFQRPLDLTLYALSILLVAFTMEGVVGKALNNRLEYWNLPTWGIVILAIGVVTNLMRASPNAHNDDENRQSEAIPGKHLEPRSA